MVRASGAPFLRWAPARRSASPPLAGVTMEENSALAPLTPP
jgi:hypothetical protein